jgi:hypothetical protein
MEMTSVAPGNSEKGKTEMIELAAREKLVRETLARELLGECW